MPIQRGFWDDLARPFTVLAPMSGITDAAFRRVLTRYGKPDVMVTEFVPADGLCSDGLENLLPILRYSKAERPIVAQLHGGNPDSFRKAACIIAELGFDGIDINMGCPSRAVEGHGGGAVLINNPPLAREIIEAAKAGAARLPVSVKTRLGYRTNEADTWLASLLEASPAALTIHARTRSQGYRGAARWEAVKQVAELAHAMHPDASERPLIIGNGDVGNLVQAWQRAAENGCDGVMLGRAAWGNPWCFTDGLQAPERPLCEVLPVMLEHTRLHMELAPPAFRRMEIMRKHFKAYLRGRRDATALRKALMQARDIADVESTMVVALQVSGTPIT